MDPYIEQQQAHLWMQKYLPIIKSYSDGIYMSNSLEDVCGRIAESKNQRRIRVVLRKQIFCNTLQNMLRTFDIYDVLWLKRSVSRRGLLFREELTVDFITDPLDIFGSYRLPTFVCVL